MSAGRPEGGRPKKLSDAWPGGRWTLLVIALVIIVAATLALQTLDDEPSGSTVPANAAMETRNYH